MKRRHLLYLAGGFILVREQKRPAFDTINYANAQAWELLHQGNSGMIVMMRHAEAPGTGDPPNFKLGDCSTQRNLSAAGRNQATRIGIEFRRRGIRINRVLSSQWCRCLETARLLNLGRVESFSALNSFFQDRSTEVQQTSAVRNLIRQNRQTSGVILLVTHQVNITALTRIVPQQGESVILQANSRNEVEVRGRLLI